ncbi:unnamed protein product [Didymodactylos carnosus]|uniref:Uncharacterized protein n=1 Tax=Didymodactylos carnosus TaxID=1234261 RepID=A0A8S2ECF4_9BILA|nr:unnamed protein product [Didymodactylos carnosus]CAF3999765.1 unnamed protein product [Didymodactylos carnosus]
MSNIIGQFENELNTASVDFLNEQIQGQCHVEDEIYQHIPLGKKKISTNYSENRSQLSVTKNQQTSKISDKNSQSEESADRLNIVNIFQNLSKKVSVNSNAEHLPTIPDNDGSDRAFHRRTYTEIVQLYNRMKNGHTLKRKDKDEYLPSKFLKSSTKWLFIHCNIERLFIDRMIADIFLEISKKQILPDDVIELLMSCVDSIDKLEQKILGGFDEKKEIAKTIAAINQTEKGHTLSSIIAPNLEIYKDSPDIVANIARKIDENMIDTIKAIYNCIMRNNSILNDDRWKLIQKYAEDEDNEFKKYIFKILAAQSGSNSVDYKNLFNNCLKDLEKGVNIDDSVDYIYQQSKDTKRCQELFNENVVSRISHLFWKTTLNEEIKNECCVIINNYLECSYSKGLNETQLKNYIYLINDPQHGSELKIEALKSMVLTDTKNQDLPEFVIETLVENVNNLTNKFANFVVVALESVSQRRTILKIDQLSTKLLNDGEIVGEETNIAFDKRSKDNSDCLSISSIVAQIFVNSLSKNVKISNQSLEYLARALNSKDKQTRILSAKALYIALETHDINNDILIELRDHVDDRIHDVSVYSTVVYARGLAKLSLTEKPILASHIEFLPTIYVFDDLQLDEKNFSDIINKNILSILLNQANNKQFEDSMFDMFDRILLSGDCHRLDVIQIIDNYSANKYPIPNSTTFALESIVGIPEISNQVLKVFANIIENGRAVGEKILHCIADNLYLSDDSLRDKSFFLLDIADNNQDISDEIFDILELERASNTITSFSPDGEYAMSYLYTQTNEGRKLTINGFRMLNKIVRLNDRINKR